MKAELTKEEKYKLAFFMVVRNSKVMPSGLALGKTSKEINQMSIRTCREILTSINFDEARKEYDDGID
ncbi:hypothetical protein ACWG0P_13925 [Amedibacillus sp. YH-ame6]